MGWDEATQRPTCSDDVWNTYVKANPNAMKFRTKGLRNYIHLAELLEGRQAIGEYASSGSQLKRSYPADSSSDNETTTTTPAPRSGSMTPALRTATAGPSKRSHRLKDKVSGSQLLSGIETLKEIAVRGKNIRLQAQEKLAKEFPNLTLKEKMAMWTIFKDAVNAEIFVGIANDEEGATAWLKQELTQVGIENPLADIP